MLRIIILMVISLLWWHYLALFGAFLGGYLSQKANLRHELEKIMK